LIEPTQCQVGFTNPPDCCTRISDQSPVATATAVGHNVHFEITSNVLPADYVYNMGLAESTSSFFSCEANNVVVTYVGATQQVSAWDVPFASLDAV